MLISSISSLSGVYWSIKFELLFWWLHILVVHCVALRLRWRVLFVVHAFCNCHVSHFAPYAPFILHFFNFSLLLFDVFFSLLLIDLLLECFFHWDLLSLSLILYDMFFVSPLHQNISMSLKFQINSVFKDPSSGFDIWKVLFGDTCIKVAIVWGFVWHILHVKCLVIGVESLLLLLLDVDAILLPLGFLPFFLLS